MNEYENFLNSGNEENLNDLQDTEAIADTSEVEIDENLMLELSFNDTEGIVRVKYTYTLPNGIETVLAPHTALLALRTWMDKNEGYYYSKFFRVVTKGGLRTIQEVQKNVSSDHVLMMLDKVN